MDNTEEEQVEAIKRWFNQYGNALIIGLLLGVTILGGYRWWNASQEKTFSEASHAFSQVQTNKSELDALISDKIAELSATDFNPETDASGEDGDETTEVSISSEQIKAIFDDESIKIKESEFLLATETLIKYFPKTSYADFSYLNRAKHYVEIGALDLAQAELNALIESTNRVILKELAMIRLSHIKIAQAEYEAAIDMLEDVGTESYLAMKSEALGDAFFFQDDYDQARSYYQTAVDTGDSAFAQLKLDAIKSPHASDEASD